MGERRGSGGRAIPAVVGGSVRFVAGAGKPANDGARVTVFEGGRAVVCLATGRVRLRRLLPSGREAVVGVALSSFRGVTVDLDLDERAQLTACRVLLTHADPALDIVLWSSTDATDVAAVWRGFARDLGVPLLLREDGIDRPARARFGALDVAAPSPRRAPRAFLNRRPRALRRRKVGVAVVRVS